MHSESALLVKSVGESQAGDASAHDAKALLRRYRSVRKMTMDLVDSLHREDMVVQSMEDTSPTKWHLAHTTWFFETFVLREHAAGYSLFHPDFPFLFNSYYVQAGPRFSRPRRGMVTRPTVDETIAYRRYVDDAMDTFLAGLDGKAQALVSELVTLGLNHEQQHQELILTDIKHVLHQNPLRPAFRGGVEGETESGPPPITWMFFEEGLFEVGRDENGAFMFDNEGPRHRVFLDSFFLADRPCTSGEYLAFVKDGGYERPELWLSEGWATVEREGWTAPLYWEEKDGVWFEYTMDGLVPLRASAPVVHVSLFEADAFARWSNARLPTEFEWEVAAADVGVEGNFVESQQLQPRVANTSTGLRQMYGDVWEWTRSQYSPYPRYAPAPGAIGEYNGKFMCNQFVLRGGSCATSATHIRRTYRNFFPPSARWQFAGIRLAADAEPDLLT
ncbi:MAG: ergothioneine biosynthesis protein EgtB [Bacteroidetes bacterium]|nr:ergothioneine biosynthesis protein EgtB [Bacteroidota bacterium]